MAMLETIAWRKVAQGWRKVMRKACACVRLHHAWPDGEILRGARLRKVGARLCARLAHMRHIVCTVDQRPGSDP